AALATVYLVWGSTYLAIRVTDRTLPPRLMSSVRFLIAGTALYVFASRGRARPTRREWLAAAIVGAALLLVGNGGVAWAETRLDSGFAALIVAIIPLYVALFDRLFFGRRPRPGRLADRALRVRVAAEERADLRRRHVRLRQSRGRGRSRHALSRRDDRMVAGRRRCRDRHGGRADRDGEAALPWNG